MNTSLGLSVSTTLRIAMDCYAYYLWFEHDTPGDGVAWHGYPAWDFADMKSRIGLDYEVITELPAEEENLYPEIMALKKNVADISIDLWGVTYERSKHIDFSYPIEYLPIYIFSGKTDTFLHSDLVKGVFDDLSYGIMALALVLMGLVSLFTRAREEKNESHGVFTCMLYVYANALKQPDPSPVLKKASGRLIMLIFFLYNHIISLMYGSIIISFLISGPRPPAINSLEDLHKTENINLRILLIKGSFIPDFLAKANMLSGLEHRVDYIDYADRFKPVTLEKILKGSHITIGTVPNIQKGICVVNQEVNYAFAKPDDLIKSR